MDFNFSQQNKLQKQSQRYIAGPKDPNTPLVQGLKFKEL
jgi:hypothetical protein